MKGVPNNSVPGFYLLLPHVIDIWVLIAQWPTNSCNKLAARNAGVALDSKEFPFLEFALENLNRALH